MKGKVCLVPFVSPFHKKEAYIGKLNFFKKFPWLSFYSPVSGEDEVLDVIEWVEQFKLALLYPLTGGTSQLLVSTIISTSTPTVLLTDGRNNSLPSALTCKRKIGKFNGNTLIKLIFLDEKSLFSFEETVSEILKVAEAFQEFIGMKIHFLGYLSNKKKSFYDPYTLKEKFNINIIQENMDFKKYLRIKLEPQWLETFKGYEIIEPSQQELEKAFKFYLLLKKFLEGKEAEVLTLDCFQLINQVGFPPCFAAAKLLEKGVIFGCEADLASTVTMFILKKLTGSQPFIMNLSAIYPEKNELLLSHCTAPLNLSAGKKKLRSHFESGLGVSVELTFKKGPVTLVQFVNPDYEKMYIAEGEIVDGNPKIESNCRSQIKVKPKFSVKKFLEENFGNHFTVVYGKHSEKINNFCKLAGIATKIYN